MSTSGQDATDCAYVAANALSASVRPASRTNRTKSGNDSFWANFVCRSLTSVDSAEAGRNAALSFFWTSCSLPDSGPAKAPTSHHAMSTRMAQVSGRLATRRNSPPPAGGAGSGAGTNGSDGGWGADTGDGLLGAGGGSATTLEPAADHGPPSSTA